MGETSRLNQKDVKALRDIIKKQNAKGAGMPENLKDGYCYLWNKKGRLVWLDISGCRLKGTLDLSGLPKLRTLHCQNNRIMELDIRKNENLKEIKCYGCRLKKIDVKGHENLSILLCSDNRLETLDLAGCTGLTALNCSGNQIMKLDVSECPHLAYLQYDPACNVIGWNETREEIQTEQEEDVEEEL